MSNDDYMDAHISNNNWPVDSPASEVELSAGLLIEYLSTLPKDTVIYCVREEKFSNGDKVVDYFPANLKDCFVVEEDKLYIGSVEI